MNAPGRLLAQLPGIYHDSADLADLLALLESVLCESPGARDRPAAQPPTIEARIAGIATLFDVGTPADVLDPWWAEARDEFVPWLAQWVALSGAAELPVATQRELIGRIVPLYAWRGTPHYLKEMLAFFVPQHTTIEIDDQFVGLVVGRTRVGSDTWLEHDRPFWFRLTIRIPGATEAEQQRPMSRPEWMARIRRVIDLAKPAHTTYDLELAISEGRGTT